MTPARLKVFFAFFPYGGNGATAAEVPSVRKWWGRTLLACSKDKRIEEVLNQDFIDTPIPMTRNEAVLTAKAAGADLLVMVDSDMYPDYELFQGEPGARPFWDSSFDFLYERKLRGLHTVIGAPYCGPPPCENVYVFRWALHSTGNPNQDFYVAQYTREEAAARLGMSGPGEIAALPTGLILYDLAVFDHVEEPYFYYEYEGDGDPCPHCKQRKPGPQAHKASTEDVTGTRDQALFLNTKLGYSPLFCNWDAWAGHWKPKCVGKPKPVTLDQISERYQNALKAGRRRDEKMVFVGSRNGPPHPPRAASLIGGIVNPSVLPEPERPAAPIAPQGYLDALAESLFGG